MASLFLHSAKKFAAGQSTRVALQRKTTNLKLTSQRTRNFGILPTKWAEDWVTKLLEKEPAQQIPMTGPELEEANFQGLKQEYLESPFGTFDAPCLVPSNNTSRVIGCTGGPGYEDEHELTWHVLTDRRPLVCMDCGQVFQLLNLNELPLEAIVKEAEQNQKIIESDARLKDAVVFDDLDVALERPKNVQRVVLKEEAGVDVLPPPSPLQVGSLSSASLDSVVDKLKKESLVLQEVEENQSGSHLSSAIDRRFK